MTPQRIISASLFALLLLFLSHPLPAAADNASYAPVSPLFQKLEEVDPEALSLAEARSVLHELKALARAEYRVAQGYAWSPVRAEEEREYSDLERRIAQEVIATGQMLGGDPRFDDVVSALAQRGQGLFSEGSGLTQGWVRENLREVLPAIDNKMAEAAMNAAANEIARGAGNMAGGFAGAATGLGGEGRYDAAGALKRTALRSGLEGVKAAAAASEIEALRRLELEYSLSGDGIDEYSALTVQPLWDSEDKRHNLFAQASYSNKQIEDIGAETSERRDTVNAGLAYRYVTKDEQHMFGANAFFDHQWPYHHNRASLGLDYKTSLYGVSFNKYFGLSDWRGRDDGFEEKALGGEDLELSGRLPQAPEFELFAKGYHWSRERTPVRNPDGGDIWGYQVAAEYTPVNAFTIRSQATKDNEMDDLEGQITLRLNYNLGQGFDDLWERPSYNLASVLDRRFEKVRRTNDIRVQARQDPDVTARVTFAQGANVSAGQSLAFGMSITTGGAAGDGATVVFGNGARLDLGQSTQALLEADRVVLTSGIIQFTSASGGITVIAVPGGTIDLIGTDVDVRVAGGATTLRVRDGAADFTDESGATRLSAEQLAESQSGDALPPQLRAEGTAQYAAHAEAAHTQLNLVGPQPSNPKAAPFADEEVSVTGALGVGQTLTFTVPLSAPVSVTGSPQLAFTLGGQARLAGYASGSGTDSLVFTYVFTGADETLSGVAAQEIEKNGGTLLGANGAPMLRTVTGTRAGSVLDEVAPTIASLTASSSGGDPANTGDVITVTLNASEDLLASGAPSLSLDVGGNARTAAFSAISSGNAEFTYTVQAGELDGDGITVTAINTGANELEDASGNDLDPTFALPSNTGIDVATVMLGQVTCPAGDLSALANAGCARLFGADPASIDDVMIYAGDVPGTSTDFFVRRCDLGASWDGAACSGGAGTQWKDDNTESDTTNIGTGTAWDNDNARDGPGNTALLVADGSGAHPAAEGCDALDAEALPGGWYLPGISELDVIYANLVATDDDEHPLPTVNQNDDDPPPVGVGPLRDSFAVGGSFYWSSSEDGSNGAWRQRFDGGAQYTIVKTTDRLVRCARR